MGWEFSKNIHLKLLLQAQSNSVQMYPSIHRAHHMHGDVIDPLIRSCLTELSTVITWLVKKFIRFSIKMLREPRMNLLANPIIYNLWSDTLILCKYPVPHNTSPNGFSINWWYWLDQLLQRSWQNGDYLSFLLYLLSSILLWRQVEIWVYLS